MDYITTREELRSAFEATHDVAIRKVLRSIDRHLLWSNDPGHPVRVINYHSTMRCSIE